MSIRENIAYGDHSPVDIPMEEIVQAAQSANIHDFIVTLPGVSSAGGLFFSHRNVIRRRDMRLIVEQKELSCPVDKSNVSVR